VPVSLEQLQGPYCAGTKQIVQQKIVMKTFAWQRYAKLMAVPLHENLHQRFVSLMPK
jgi:hypothetical protein